MCSLELSKSNCLRLFTLKRQISPLWLYTKMDCCMEPHLFSIRFHLNDCILHSLTSTHRSGPLCLTWETCLSGRSSPFPKNTFSLGSSSIDGTLSKGPKGIHCKCFWFKETENLPVLHRTIEQNLRLGFDDVHQRYKYARDECSSISWATSFVVKRNQGYSRGEITINFLEWRCIRSKFDNWHGKLNELFWS